MYGTARDVIGKTEKIKEARLRHRPVCANEESLHNNDTRSYTVFVFDREEMYRR